MNCQEITIKINEIQTKKTDFDSIFKTDVPRALILKKELQLSIQQIKEQLKPVFRIEGKEFPVFKLEIGGKTAQELRSEILSKNIVMSEYAEDMIHSSDFFASPKIEQINLVRLKVSDLGFSNSATIDEIYAKAQEFGLELCPAEVGLYQRLKDEQQVLNDWYLIAMKQITDRSGGPGVFNLHCSDDGLSLDDSWAVPVSKWNAGSEFVFRVPTKSIK